MRWWSKRMVYEITETKKMSSKSKETILLMGPFFINQPHLGP
jgi:hypothetical protein